VQVKASPGTIFSDAQDGCVGSGGYLTSDVIAVGDDGGNLYRQGFVKFSLAVISGTLSSARLYLYVFYSALNGNGYSTSPLPNPGLGDLLVRHIDDYGTLDQGDFNATSIGNDPGELLSFSATPNVGYVSIDVTAAMQDDIDHARSYSSFMLYLTTDTDHDSANDDWYFYASENTGTTQDPYIDYTFGPPGVADLEGFSMSPGGDVLMVIGDLTNNPHGSKPSGVNYQIGRDMTPLGYVRGMLNNTQPDIFDTNPAVNVTTGRPAGDWPLIFSLGGPGINAVSYYYETTSTQLDRAPVTFSMNATHYVWTDKNDQEVLAVLRSSCSVPPGTTDVFVIQVLQDADGRLVAIMYGTRYTGTWAAAEYFKFTIYPNISAYTNSYYIVRWTDAASGASANFMPDSGDDFTILAQG